MSREEILGWAGLVFGIPSVVALFLTGARRTAVVVLLLSLVVIGLLLFIHWSNRRDDFTVRLVEKRLVFKDPAGRVAILHRTQTMRPNHKGLTEFWFTNISSDGSIKNIQIDGAPPSDIERAAGDLRICRRWPTGALKRGRDVTVQTSYELHDSFAGNPEGFIHVVAYRTKLVRLTVQMHPSRPALAARATLGFGGQVHSDIGGLLISGNGMALTLEVRRPKRGSEYEIEWDWAPAVSLP